MKSQRGWLGPRLPCFMTVGHVCAWQDQVCFYLMEMMYISLHILRKDEPIRAVLLLLGVLETEFPSASW